MNVCVLLPTLNEEKGVRKVIENMPNPVVDKIVVIDGYSSDNTILVAKSLNGRAHAETMFQDGEGKGMAFQTFLKNFDLDDYDVYVMLDADMTYDPKEIEKVIYPILSKEADVVMGDRFYNGLGDTMDFLTFFGNKMLTLVSGFLYFKRVKDLCTGYWAFSRNFLKEIEINAKGFDLEANIFTEAVKKNFRIKTVPIKYKTRIGEKKLKHMDGFVILKRLVKERF